MSDFDDQARAAGERVRRDAERIAGTIEPFASPSDSGPGRSSHWLLAAAAVVVVVAGIGGLLLAANRDAGVDTVSPPPDSRPATTMIAEPPTTTEPTPTTATVPTTAEPPTVASIRRPIVDPAVCTPISATSGGRSGLPRDPGSSRPVTLFTRGSDSPVPIQIIAAPVDGQAKPFAVVLRYVGRQRQLVSPENTESINGIDIFVGTYDNGNGEAEWTLPDGSMGYLRSRGLDREQLVSILTQLTPRPADALIPGFDFGADGPDGLELVAEQLNTEPRDASFAGSQCRVESTGYVYRIVATTGNPVFTFAMVIDRPPPVDVAVVGDAVIVINGIADAAAPRASDVLDADEEPWRQLLISSEAGPEPELAQLIGGDNEVVVDFVPIDDTSTLVSSLTLRVDVTDGVAFLEVYTNDALVAGAAEYWKTEIDGRMRSRSSATPGEGRRGAFGSRLGDSPSFEQLTEEFTVRISTTDGDDQTIQTTGTIRLVPILAAD